MKFCYLDESGVGNEPVLVMARVNVDVQRMHQTKIVMSDFLDSPSQDKCYPTRGRYQVAQNYWDVAPECLRR